MKELWLSTRSQQAITTIKLIFNQIQSWMRFPDNVNSIVLLIIGLHLCITLPLAASLNVWLDEAFSLNTTSKDIGYAIFHSINFEGQPPLFFAILKLWRTLNNSIVFARLFSVFCISLTIYTTAVFSRRYLKDIHPGWIAAVVAFHPFSIWASLEVRMYAFAILISALLLLFFFDGYLADTPNRRARLFYGLCAIAGMYTNYLLACLLIGHGLTLLFFKKWRAFYYYLITMAGVGVFLLPIVLVLFFHVTRLKGILTGYSSSLIESLTATIKIVRIYLLALNDRLLPAKLTKIIRYGLILILLLVALIYRRFITFYQTSLFSITLTTSLILAIVLYKMNAVQNIDRYAYPLFIVVVISLFSLLSIVRGSLKQKLLIGFTVFLLSVSLLSISGIYSLSAKEGDWKRVSSYIMAREQPNQPILVFTDLHLLPLSYYYSGINQLVPIPRAMGEEKLNVQKLVLRDEKEILSALAKIPAKHQHLWLVSNVQQIIPGYQGEQKCEVLNIDLNCHILADFIDKYYSIQNIESFYKSFVIFMSRKS